MKRLFLPLAPLALILPSQGAAFIADYSGLNLAIPDGNPSGLANVQTVIAPDITQIQSVKVTLNVTGTFNGDLFAYLQHGSGLSVLLNRPGRTTLNLFGYDDDGLSVTFDDLAADDIHTYRVQVGSVSPLTGTWQPDGRFADPDAVTEVDGRTAMLDVFNGIDANGDWTLFVADLSGGDLHQLSGWSIEIQGIPEPGTASLLVLAAGLLARRRR